MAVDHGGAGGGGEVGLEFGPELGGCRGVGRWLVSWFGGVGRQEGGGDGGERFVDVGFRGKGV